MNIERLILQLKADEGFSPTAYWDRDHWTYGFGTPAPGPTATISYKAAESILEDRTMQAVREFETIVHDCRENINDIRAEALVNMLFNLGETRFLGFRKMRAAIRRNDWMEAAYQAQDSKWFKQTGRRAKRIVRQLATGKREE